MQVEFCRESKVAKRIVVGVLFALLFAYCLISPFVIATIKQENNKIQTIVIDAGHGGADGGVKGTKTGVEEKTLNLIMANFLGEILSGWGYDVVYTRRNDTMYAFEGISDNHKRADMYKRAEIVKSANASALVSIHMNFYSLPTRRGAQVFYSKKNEKSKEFAKCVQNTLNENINLKEGGRGYGALCAKKYLLECASCASIIVECGFLSNQADEKNLVNAQYQQRMAFVIATSIATFLSE